MEGEMQEKDLLLRHVNEINKISEYYRNAPKMFIPEVNYGMRDHLPNMLIGQPNMHIFVDPKTGKEGVWKNQHTAGEYRWFTSNALYHRNIKFDDGLFTTSRLGDDTAPIERIMNMLQDQLERYHYIEMKAKNAFGVDKVKLHGKSGGKNDDLVMVFMMALTWGKVCLSDPAVLHKLNHTRGGGAYITQTQIREDDDITDDGDDSCHSHVNVNMNMESSAKRRRIAV